VRTDVRPAIDPAARGLLRLGRRRRVLAAARDTGEIRLVSESVILHKRVTHSFETPAAASGTGSCPVEMWPTPMERFWQNLCGLRNYIWTKRVYEGQSAISAAGTTAQFVVKHVLYDDRPLKRIPGSSGSPATGAADASSTSRPPNGSAWSARAGSDHAVDWLGVSAVSLPHARGPARSRLPRPTTAPPPAAAVPRLPLVVLGLLVAAASAYVQRIGWQTSTFTNDELWGVVGRAPARGRLLRLHRGLRHFNRGPERLVSVMQVLPNALFADAADAAAAIHVLLAVAYFLTVRAGVPAGPRASASALAGRSRWAALVVLTPWVVFGATTLTVHGGAAGQHAVRLRGVARRGQAEHVGRRPRARRGGAQRLSRTGPRAVQRSWPCFAVVYAVWLRRPGRRAGRSRPAAPARPRRAHATRSSSAPWCSPRWSSPGWASAPWSARPTSRPARSRCRGTRSGCTCATGSCS
jgi:hypothetical protein